MLFFAVTVLALECSLAYPALAGSVWTSYGAAFGLTAVTLGVGAGIAGYRSARQGKGFWNGFAEHVHNNWSQEVAITSAIFIVSLGITTAKFAIENAVSKKALEKANKVFDYPPNNGAVLGTEKIIVLQTGKYSRYGKISENSRYITEFGADPSTLSLPPWNNGKVKKITVLKPISNVTQSIIAPWYLWKGVGGGTQYLLPESLITLKNMGFLKF